MKLDIQNMIKAVRMLEEIHQPEYRMWISMENISALCDEIERLSTPKFGIGETVRVDRFDGDTWAGTVKAISEIEYSISFDSTNNSNIWFPESQVHKL